MLSCQYHCLIQVQEEESVELSEMEMERKFEVKGGTENVYGKVNILLQAYISQLRIESFSLLSDSLYVAQVGVFQRSSKFIGMLFYKYIFVSFHFST